MQRLLPLLTTYCHPPGRNPFDGYTPKVPHGEKLDFCSDEFLGLEEQGLREVAGAAFVLVAGGLGERLGYSGATHLAGYGGSLAGRAGPINERRSACSWVPALVRVLGGWAAGVCGVQGVTGCTGASCG